MHIQRFTSRNPAVVLLLHAHSYCAQQVRRVPSGRGRASCDGAVEDLCFTLRHTRANNRPV